MNEGVRTRQEGGVNEWRIPTTHLNMPPCRWPLSGHTRDAELRPREKATKNPNHEILLGMQARESACVDRVCVSVCGLWHLTFNLTSSSHRRACVGWPFTNNVGVCMNNYVRICTTANVILKLRDNVGAS